MADLVLASELTLFLGAGFSTLYLSLKNRRTANQTTILNRDESGELLRLQSFYGYNPHSLVSVLFSNLNFCFNRRFAFKFSPANNRPADRRPDRFDHYPIHYLTIAETLNQQPA